MALCDPIQAFQCDPQTLYWKTVRGWLETNQAAFHKDWLAPESGNESAANRVELRKPTLDSRVSPDGRSIQAVPRTAGNDPYSAKYPPVDDQQFVCLSLKGDQLARVLLVGYMPEL